jgi:hypothetical protein
MQPTIKIHLGLPDDPYFFLNVFVIPAKGYPVYTPSTKLIKSFTFEKNAFKSLWFLYLGGNISSRERYLKS